MPPKGCMQDLRAEGSERACGRMGGGDCGSVRGFLHAAAAVTTMPPALRDFEAGQTPFEERRAVRTYHVAPRMRLGLALLAAIALLAALAGCGSSKSSNSSSP